MKNNKLTIFMVIAIILTIGFGCKSINIPSLGGGGGVTESTDPKTAVTSAYKKFMDAKSYHSVTKSKNAQAEVITELDYSAPDRFLIKNNVPNFKTEMIIIGNDSFTRLNDGKWTKTPQAPGASVNEIRGKLTEEAFAAMKDFELIGKESVNGKDAIAYKFKSSYMGESSSKVWISTDKGLPIKTDSEGSYGGVNVTISITYDYDKEVKIEVPDLK